MCHEIAPLLVRARRISVTVMVFLCNQLYQYPNWFESFLEDYSTIEFPEAGTWQICYTIEEKSSQFYNLSEAEGIMEAVGPFSAYVLTSPSQAKP